VIVSETAHCRDRLDESIFVPTLILLHPGAAGTGNIASLPSKGFRGQARDSGPSAWRNLFVYALVVLLAMPGWSRSIRRRTHESAV